MHQRKPIFSRIEFVIIVIVTGTITALLSLFTNEAITQVAMLTMAMAVFVVGGARDFLRSRRHRRAD